MNLKDVTSSALNNETTMESLEETMKTLGVEFDLTNVPFEAYYTDKGLSTLSMVFDDFFKGHYGTLGSIKMSFKYRNISYGENLEKKEFDFSNFTSVANTYYELALLAEMDQYNGGTGLQFYSYSPDEPFKDQVPNDFIIGRLEIRAASFSRAIYFRDLTYNEITRMYEFKFLGKKFSWNEKIEIAKRHLVPQELDNLGMKDSGVKLSKAAIEKIIEDYTRESGVRDLDKKINKVLRKVTLKYAKDGELPEGELKVDDIKEYLKQPKETAETYAV